MNKSKPIEDFIFARKKVAQSITSASGWDLGVFNHQLSGRDNVFFYTMDLQTNFVWSCSVPKDVFFTCIQQLKDTPIDHCSSFCGQMIEKASKVQLGKDEEDLLAFSLAVYFSKTQTYSITNNTEDANHFFVMRYGAKDKVRPFAAPGSTTHLMPAEDVQSLFRQVIELDSRNHPEWF